MVVVVGGAVLEGFVRFQQENLWFFAGEFVVDCVVKMVL
jgi:hypothetical protein